MPTVKEAENRPPLAQKQKSLKLRKKNLAWRNRGFISNKEKNLLSGFVSLSGSKIFEQKQKLWIFLVQRNFASIWIQIVSDLISKSWNIFSRKIILCLYFISFKFCFSSYSWVISSFFDIFGLVFIFCWPWAFSRLTFSLDFPKQSGLVKQISWVNWLLCSGCKNFHFTRCVFVVAICVSSTSLFIYCDAIGDFENKSHSTKVTFNKFCIACSSLKLKQS